MAATLTPNEEAQLVQTIEMFEVIVQSQPDDVQSLEILKEAYAKLAREKDIVHTAKRIAEAYVQMGQLSSAILEYESILQKYPDDTEVQNALAEIENRASNLSGGQPAAVEVPSASAPSEPAKDGKAKPGARVDAGDFDDGKSAMQKLFVDAKLISVTDFEAFWPKVNPHDPPGGVIDPFVQLLQDKGVLPIEKAIKFLAEKTRLGYMPLDKYDVDVEFARTFPREACQRWCILPFDKMSKAVMVATTNPFNKAAIREIEAVTKNRIIWYLASPVDLTKTLKKIFR